MMGEHGSAECPGQEQDGHDGDTAPAGHEHGEGALECPRAADQDQQGDAPGPN
jgi:hypothetical protein